MFNANNFAELYQLLSQDMMAEDCGLKCQQYCCRAAQAIKYFLPGEAEFFQTHTPPNLTIVDHFIYEGYRASDQLNCACTRELRPFCCRIFPFRPVVDQSSWQVIGLRKATSPSFAKYCWVETPLPSWQSAAMAAWQLVLADLDNLSFYARYALFLSKARQEPYLSSYTLLAEVQEQLAALTPEQLWPIALALFDMLGYPPEEWQDIVVPLNKG